MAGEIKRIQTSDGTDHLIDYRSLANRPDIDGIVADVAGLSDSVASIVAALRMAGIDVDGQSAAVDGTVLSVPGGSVSGRTLSVSEASVVGTKLVF